LQEFARIKTAAITKRGAIVIDGDAKVPARNQFGIEGGLAGSSR
jgi:hypothetical protein